MRGRKSRTSCWGRRLTACKPISDDDLGRYLVSCLSEPRPRPRVLPVAGAGPCADTPREMGAMLFELTGRAPVYRSVPPGFLRVGGGGSGTLRTGCRARPRNKAELSRGRGINYANPSRCWSGMRRCGLLRRRCDAGIRERDAAGALTP